MRFSRDTARQKRHARLRRKVVGTSERPRLAIYRSLHHIYAQIIDDGKGHTLVSASTREKALAAELTDGVTNVAAAAKIGTVVGRRAIEAGLHRVVFDTSGLKYHGRVQALADAAREAGLEF